MANFKAVLQNKTLVMVVGPSAVGKSSIMHAATRIDHRFSYVTSFTTRPDRGDGSSTYRHLSEAEASAIEASGEAVTFLRHPTTHYIYGTDLASYANEYNLLDSLSDSVERYRALPFKQTTTVSITTDPEAWKLWLRERYPAASAERAKRLKEAVLSIEWSLAQHTGHYWVVNRSGKINTAATELIQIAVEDAQPQKQPPEAKAMLQMAKDLLSYEY